jgi:hypothetical protein
MYKKSSGYCWCSTSMKARLTEDLLLLARDEKKK